MPNVPHDLQSIRKRTALTHAQIGRIIGLNEQAIRHIEMGLKPLPKKAMGILTRMKKEMGKAIDDHAPLTESSEPPLPTSSLPKDLPILGFAQGGLEGNDVANQEAIDWTYRPASLASVRDAFAVFVTGDSMEPTYKAGDLVYINPQSPPRKGAFVLVEVEGHRGFIKKFLRWCGDHLVLEQFNPQSELWISKHRLIRMMTVVDGRLD